MGVDARACRDRVVLDRSIVARDCGRSAALARENRETRKGARPHALAKFALCRPRRFGVGRDQRASRRRQSPADAFGGVEMDRRQWPHARARLGGQCAPRIDLGRGSHARGSFLDWAQHIGRCGLVGRDRQSHSTRLGRERAPRIDLGRGSRADGSFLDWAQRIEGCGMVGRDGQSHSTRLSGECAPRIDLGRGSLASGSDLDWAQRIERCGVVGRDGQRGGASPNRREPRELFQGHASDARRLERGLRRCGAFYRAYRPRARRPAKHGAHLLRAEAARFFIASRELEPLLHQVERGPRISLIAA
jgi:hypothetical protein